jgi:ABC-2 type transport system ATP-binding protein
MTSTLIDDDVMTMTAASATPALVATGLGKRYGRRWALRGCDVAIPVGSVTALIGPNGAGKSTLLQIAAGLVRPTEGAISVLGQHPMADAATVLPRIGFVAQDRPLYGQLTVAETLTLGARLNPGWDAAFAEERVGQLGLDPRQRAGKLSGGQQAQLALVLALGKRPDLLLLDEPMAALDPAARREAMQLLMGTVAGDAATVVLSSHNVADIERICDHLVILSGGRVVASGDLETFQTEHHLLTGPRATDAELAAIAASGEIVRATHTDRQTTLLVRGDGPPPDSVRWTETSIGLEDLIIEYIGRSDGTGAGQPGREVA